MDAASIAATMMAMNQAQTHDQISLSIMKMKAQAEAAMADMLVQNARQVQALSSSSSNLVDLFV